MTTAGRALVDIQQFVPVAIGVDDTGVGGGVVDRLRQLETYVTAVNFGGRAFDDSRFANRGAEIFWLTRQAFEENLIGFDMSDPDAIDELVVELNRPTYSTDPRGRIVVDKYGRNSDHLSEEDRVTRSPDRADSFVIAYSVARPSIGPDIVRDPPENEWDRLIRLDIEHDTARSASDWGYFEQNGDSWGNDWDD